MSMFIIQVADDRGTVSDGSIEFRFANTALDAEVGLFVQVNLSVWVMESERVRVKERGGEREGEREREREREMERERMHSNVCTVTEEKSTE